MPVGGVTKKGVYSYASDLPGVRQSLRADVAQPPGRWGRAIASAADPAARHRRSTCKRAPRALISCAFGFGLMMSGSSAIADADAETADNGTDPTRLTRSISTSIEHLNLGGVLL